MNRDTFKLDFPSRCSLDSLTPNDCSGVLCYDLTHKSGILVLLEKLLLSGISVSKPSKMDQIMTLTRITMFYMDGRTCGACS